MATKTIIRYKPYSPLVGERTLSPADFQSIGIFTQKTRLVFQKERSWWLDAEAAKVSKEALQWFEDSSEFTVEHQDVGEDEDPETLRQQEAYAASLGPTAQPTTSALAADLGASKSTSDTTSSASTTTQSTAKG